MKPVAADKQWTLWPRIARPFACRTCGATYQPSLDSEIESKQTQIMGEGRAADAPPPGHPLVTALGLGIPTHVHDRVPRFRYCRNPECIRFYDYDEEGRLRAREADTFRLLVTRRRGLAPTETDPMRKRWLPMPKAANGE